MIDHLSIPTTKYETIAFYDASLKALGAERCVNMTAHWNADWPEQRICAYGVGGKPVFWVGEAKSADGTRHIAFSAEDVAAVKGFYEGGLAAGGKRQRCTRTARDLSPWLLRRLSHRPQRQQRRSRLPRVQRLESAESFSDTRN